MLRAQGNLAVLGEGGGDMARRLDICAFALVAIGAVLTGTSLAGADGTETLGPPSVAVKSGSGIAVGGVGLLGQPGTLTVNVPADATVEQALLYYEVGHHTSGSHSTFSSQSFDTQAGPAVIECSGSSVFNAPGGTDGELYNVHNYDVKTFDLAAPVPAGTYDINTTSFDGWVGRKDLTGDKVEKSERWTAEFLDAGGHVVGKFPGATKDLPDDTDLAIVHDTFAGVTLSGAATKVRAILVDDDTNLNLVHIGCIGFAKSAATTTLVPAGPAGGSDGTITVNGTEVSCALIGGPAFFYGDVESETRRCDITANGWVKPGPNSLSIGGLDPDDINDGAGILVIYRQPGKAADITLYDGNDIAFVDFPEPRHSTVPQTFTVTPSSVARVANLALMVASIADGTAPDFTPRPSTLKITSGGVETVIYDPFTGQGDGAQWDSGRFDVTIPAGASSVTVQLLSEWGRDGLPASLVWVSAALAVPKEVAAPPNTGTGGQTPPTPGAGAGPAQATVPTVAPQGVTPATPVPVRAVNLPVTGGEAEQRAVLGAAAMAAGLALVAGSRRRFTLSSR